MTVDKRPQLPKSGPGLGERLLDWLRVFLPG
jgi:hypothetical protein